MNQMHNRYENELLAPALQCCTIQSTRRHHKRKTHHYVTSHPDPKFTCAK